MMSLMPVPEEFPPTPCPPINLVAAKADKFGANPIALFASGVNTTVPPALRIETEEIYPSSVVKSPTGFN